MRVDESFVNSYILSSTRADREKIDPREKVDVFFKVDESTPESMSFDEKACAF